MMFPATSTARRAPRDGFTLVEIMVVVVVIGLLAAIAIPAFKRVQRRTENTRFVSDLRTLSQAFDTYALKNGTWPPSAAAGVVPTGMTDEISASVWARANTLGGRWQWFSGDNGITAALGTSAGRADEEQWSEIDAMVDSGDDANSLNSGVFRKVANRYVYVLAQ